MVPKIQASSRVTPDFLPHSWGDASTHIIHGLWNEHTLAIIASDRNAARLSEQLALKSFVPVLALSDDKTLTSADVPSIFRLPAATPPATALHLLEVAEARSGPNPQQVRNVLASGNPISGLAFLPTGNPHAVTKPQASQKQPNSGILGPDSGTWDTY